MWSTTWLEFRITSPNSTSPSLDRLGWGKVELKPCLFVQSENYFVIHVYVGLAFFCIVSNRSIPLS